MQKYFGLAALLFSLAIAGCSAVSSESLYEGIRTQQKSNGGGIDPKQSILPSYQQYQQERQKLQ